MHERKSIVCLLATTLSLSPLTLAASTPLKLTKTVSLPHVKGGFDLMAVDLAGQRLFVAAEDNNGMEVIDLATGKHLQSVGGLREPKWVVYRTNEKMNNVSSHWALLRLAGSLSPAANELNQHPAGFTVKLSQVADVSEEPGQIGLRREDLRQLVGVTARLEGRDLGSAMTEIRQKLG